MSHVLPKHPSIDIKYGMLDQTCEKKWKDWVKDLVTLVSKNPELVDEVAEELYEDLTQLGYDYGVESAEEDNAWRQ